VAPSELGFVSTTDVPTRPLGRERAARISQRTVRAWLLDHEAPRRVTLCVFSPADLELQVSIAREELASPT